jgi:hypothetical protein
VGSGACGGNAFSAGPPDAAAEGSLLDVSSGEGGGGDGGADSGDAALSGKIVYVSNAIGDDTNAGTDLKHPKKTIVSGLAGAALLGVGAEVHVCAGNYAESSLVVDKDVKLEGSYDCLLWVRSPTYGWPSFDGKNQSIVTNAAPTAQPATLTVLSPMVTVLTAIDGFAIVGASGTVGPSFGIDVQGSSSPVISNDVVTGAASNSAPNGPYGSVGIRVGGSSAAEVKDDVSTGGGGQGAIGSVGIVVTSTGAASVHDDVVSGGTGSSTGAAPALGAVGVAILAAPAMPNPVTGLLVSGADSAGLAGRSVGIFVSGTGVGASIQGCDIQGGNGTADNTASVGVELQTSGTVALLADRIVGGTRKGGSSQTVGIHSVTGGPLSVFDSEVHAGEVVSGNGSSAAAIFLEAGSAPAIVDDTLYSGAASGGYAVLLGQGVVGAVVSGDILLGGGAASSDVALSAVKCSGSFASVDHTAFVNFPLVYECTTPTTVFATDPGTMATDLGSSVVTPTNVELVGACTGSMTWCVSEPACPSTPTTACAQSIFGSTFTSSDDGVSGMFDGPPAADGGTTAGAWSLAPGAPCALAQRGVVNSSISTDIFGTSRGNMPSMGAVQYTQTIPCEN